MTVGVCTVFTFERLIQHLFATNSSTRLVMTVGVCTVFTFERLIQQLFTTNTSTRLAVIVGVCTVFILSKTYSTSACQQHFYKTSQDCSVLHCIHLSKTYSAPACKHPFLQGCPWLLRSALYSSFQRLIQHLFFSNISTSFAMTVGVCTVFILSKTNVCQQHFYKTCHDCWDLHCIHPFKDLFNICLSARFLQDLSCLLGSALYSSFQRLVQHLFVSNISTRLAMTVGVCTVFILSKTCSTSICLSATFQQDLPWLLGFALYSPLKDLFNICLPPTLPQDLPWLLGSALYLYFQRLI